VGRVDALLKSIDLLNRWLKEVDTIYKPRNCIMEYAKGRGSVAISDICHGRAHRYELMAREQAKIGWHQFMEGMVCKGMRNIQETYTQVKGYNITSIQWTQGLIIKLLEATYGQWLYRCVQIHDRVSGTWATARKEEIHLAIEAQQEMGTDDLLEEDQYFAVVNLEDLESTLGEHQEYWLIAIRAAPEASILRGRRQPNSCGWNIMGRGQMHQ
jgi:hypothetical protein